MTESTGAERYLKTRLENAEYHAAYDSARNRIDQIDALLRALDERREALHLTKAELGRRAGIKPAAIRRLFSAQHPNPTLDTVVALADALDLDIRTAARPRRAVTPERSDASRTPRRTA